MSDYAIEEVRRHYAYRMAGDRIHRTDDYYAAFDRALAAHDAQVLRDAAERLATHNLLLPRGHATMGVLVDWLRVEANRIEEERG